MRVYIIEVTPDGGWLTKPKDMTNLHNLEVQMFELEENAHTDVYVWNSYEREITICNDHGAGEEMTEIWTEIQQIWRERNIRL